MSDIKNIDDNHKLNNNLGNVEKHDVFHNTAKKSMYEIEGEIALQLETNDKMNDETKKYFDELAKSAYDYFWKTGD